MSRSRPRRSVTVPVAATSFVGRTWEIREARRLLAANRLVTLTGPTGVGKTRLAMQVADDSSPAFPDGVRVVQLAALQDGALVSHTVAEALGIPDEVGEDPALVLVEHLRDRRLLLVLDNCEHLIEGCAALIETVLCAAAGVRFLATSQHRLGLLAEQLFEVAPLPVPDPGEPAQAATDASRFPAVELFADRVAAVDPGFRITPENQPAVVRLCRRLDGVPLAIELAAQLCRVLTVDQLVVRLDDRFRLLVQGDRTAMTRHQTLRAAVDWSYELCTEQEQRVWALLSAFAGTCDLPGAEAVCAQDGITPAAVLDAVAGLVDKSVLAAERDGTTIRYRMLSSVQDYGRQALTRHGTAQAVHRRHRDYYLGLVEDYERQWFGPAQAAIVEHLRAEHDNLRAALHFCLTTPGEARRGLRLAGALWFYWNCRAVSGEGRQWMRDLAVRAGVGQLGDREKAHWAVGLTTMINNRTVAVLLADGPPVAPSEPVDRPVPPLADIIATSADMVTFAVLSRIELACTLTLRGRPERAVSMCLEALAVCRQRGEQWARSYALRTLATARWSMGEHDQATAHIRECLRTDPAVLGPHGLGRALELLAASAADQGAAERAAVLLGAAEQLRPAGGRSPAEPDRRAGGILAGERRARHSMGELHFTAAFGRGRALTAEQAVAYALQNGSEPPARDRTPATSRADPLAELTPRQKQVAELIAQGLTNTEIAAALAVSRRTAESHVEHILAKLGFTGRAQVAAWFARHRP